MMILYFLPSFGAEDSWMITFLLRIYSLPLIHISSYTFTDKENFVVRSRSRHSSRSRSKSRPKSKSPVAKSRSRSRSKWVQNICYFNNKALLYSDLDSCIYIYIYLTSLEDLSTWYYILMNFPPQSTEEILLLACINSII